MHKERLLYHDYIFPHVQMASFICCLCFCPNGLLLTADVFACTALRHRHNCCVAPCYLIHQTMDGAIMEIADSWALCSLLLFAFVQLILYWVIRINKQSMARSAYCNRMNHMRYFAYMSRGLHAIYCAHYYIASYFCLLLHIIYGGQIYRVA